MHKEDKFELFKEAKIVLHKEDPRKQKACIEQGRVLVQQLMEAEIIKRGSVNKLGESGAKLLVETPKGYKASVDVVIEARGTVDNPDYVYRVKASHNEDDHAKKDYSFTRAIKLGLGGMQDKMEKVLAYSISYQMTTGRRVA